MPTTEPTLEAILWPGDGRTMLRLPDGLWVDERPVSHADYARFVAATGHPAPASWVDAAPPAGRELAPVVGVDSEDARAYARWARKRLPLQREFQRVTGVLSFQGQLGGGLVWEMTASPHRDGLVVRGGPYRNQPGTRGEARHRSWEDAGADDLGFRCVADDLPAAAAERVEAAGAAPAEADTIDPGVDTILTTSRGIVVVGMGAVVDVDITSHDLLLRCAGRIWRYGTTSAGVLQCVRTIQLSTSDRHASAEVLQAVDDALRRLAIQTRPEVADALAAMDKSGLFRSPLLYSRGVLEHPHLLRDLAHYRAAAIALVMLDAEADADDVTPEYAAHLAGRLARWQRLYLHPQSALRSVNRTLALFGDDATPTALWGLRRLPLQAPVTSLQHLEVLGHLFAVLDHRDTPAGPALRTIVERATPAQLGEALVLVDEGIREGGVLAFGGAWGGDEAPGALLAEILRAAPLGDLLARGGRPRFVVVLEEALHALRHVMRLSTEVVSPAIPPPAVDGVRLLRTVAEIVEEGVVMGHCVATRAPRALAGDSHLFHVSFAGDEATAEVSSSGQVLEVRGPGNGRNRACDQARRVLRPWGRLLGLRQLTEPWPVPDGLVVPDGLRLVGTPTALLAATLAILPMQADHGDQLTAFVTELATLAGRGRAVAAIDDDKVIFLFDTGGQQVASSEDLYVDAFGGATPPAGVYRPAIADDDSDDEDGWDMRT